MNEAMVAQVSLAQRTLRSARGDGASKDADALLAQLHTLPENQAARSYAVQQQRESFFLAVRQCLDDRQTVLMVAVCRFRILIVQAEMTQSGQPQGQQAAIGLCRRDWAVANAVPQSLQHVEQQLDHVLRPDRAPVHFVKQQHGRKHVVQANQVALLDEAAPGSVQVLGLYAQGGKGPSWSPPFSLSFVPLSHWL